MTLTLAQNARAAAPARRRGPIRSPLADPVFGPLPGLLLMLTAVTGVVDALSILALGRVFVANMTGNVVFAGFALVGAPGFSLSASLFALAGFLAGAAVGGTLIARAGPDRGTLLRAGTAAELALAAAALLLAALSGAPGVSHGTMGMTGGAFGPAVTDGLAALLAAAMGIQNAVARKLAVPDMTTTVLTMTLTGLGADFRAVLRDRGSARPARAGGPRAAAAGGRHNVRRGGRQRLTRPARERPVRARPGDRAARRGLLRRGARRPPPRRVARRSPADRQALTGPVRSASPRPRALFPR